MSSGAKARGSEDGVGTVLTVEPLLQGPEPTVTSSPSGCFSRFPASRPAPVPQPGGPRGTWAPSDRAAKWSPFRPTAPRTGLCLEVPLPPRAPARQESPRWLAGSHGDSSPCGLSALLPVHARASQEDLIHQLPFERREQPGEGPQLVSPELGPSQLPVCFSLSVRPSLSLCLSLSLSLVLPVTACRAWGHR